MTKGTIDAIVVVVQITVWIQFFVFLMILFYYDTTIAFHYIVNPCIFINNTWHVQS